MQPVGCCSFASVISDYSDYYKLICDISAALFHAIVADITQINHWITQDNVTCSAGWDERLFIHAAECYRKLRLAVGLNGLYHLLQTHPS